MCQTSWLSHFRKWPQPHQSAATTMLINQQSSSLRQDPSTSKKTESLTAQMMPSNSQQKIKKLFKVYILYFRSFSGGSVVKNLPTTKETQVQSMDWENPLEQGMTTHSSTLAWRTPWTEESGGVLLPGELHGQRSLVGYSPWGRKEPDMTERPTHTHCILRHNAITHLTDYIQ